MTGASVSTTAEPGFSKSRESGCFLLKLTSLYAKACRFTSIKVKFVGFDAKETCLKINTSHDFDIVWTPKAHKMHLQQKASQSIQHRNCCETGWYSYFIIKFDQSQIIQS
jgi:hypothetical protein